MVAGVSTFASEVVGQKAAVKVVVQYGAENSLRYSLAVMAYSALGGGNPPAYLQLSAGVQSADVQRDLGLFFRVSCNVLRSQHRGGKWCCGT